MRFEELHLERFGHFDDLRLDLSGDEVLLHVIYGANEAGKSTTLAAICDVLFGFPHITPYSFLHENSRLRLGATITNAAGERLSFKRRKARDHGLLKPDESGELPENSLVPFLGGATEEFFTRMFGLDHQRLRLGGKAMLDAGGDVARSLFEAGAGTANLAGVVNQLSADANDIGAPDGRKSAGKPYWQAHERFDKANSDIREATLRVADWKAGDHAVTEAKAQLKEAQEALATSRREYSALERYRRVAPILRRIDDIQSDLDALGEGVELPVDFAEIWQRGVRASEDAFSELARLNGALEQLQRDLKVLGSADPWPAQDERITALITDLGDYRSKRRDIPNRERDLELGWGHVADLLKKLGLTIPPGEIADKAPSSQSVGRVKALISEWNRWDANLHTAHKELDQINAAVRQTQQKLDDAGSPVDPAAAAAAMESALKLGNTTERHIQAKSHLAQTQEDLAIALARLERWSLSADELARRSFPSGPAIAQSVQYQERLDRDQETLLVERERVRTMQRGLESELVALQAAGEVPTPDALRVAREHRDNGWRLIRRRYIECTDVPDLALTEFSGGAGIAEAYEGTVHHSDSLADGREQEADRIARFATYSGQLEKSRAELAALKERQEDLNKQQRDWEDDWKSLWQESGVEFGDPVIMREWLLHKDKVLELYQVVRTAKSAEQEAADEDSEAHDHLLRAAGELGINNIEALSAAVLREKVTVTLKGATELWTALTDSKKTLAARREEAAERQEDLKRVETALENWKKQWAVNITALGLTVNATTAEASEALSVWQEIETERRDLQQTTKRLSDMQDVIARYEFDVRSLLEDLGDAAAELANETDFAALVPKLRDKLDHAKRLQARIEDVQARIGKAKSDIQAAEERLDVANRDLASHRRIYDLDEDADVFALAKASDDRRALKERLEAEQVELASNSDGLNEIELRVEVGKLKADDVAAAIALLDGDLTRHQLKVQEAIQSLTEVEGDLKRMGGREGAGASAQEANDAAAEMVDHIEQWLRLKAANIILSRAIERYREANQHPLVQRASEIFAAMATTGNNPIERLSVDYTDAEKPELVGYRADGRICHVLSRVKKGASDLSDGTLDQLYLALRIAAIERHMEKVEPLPFIGDDVFITSDEDRTAAGVQALAELGRRTQVLLFTHHQYVVDAARSKLSPKHIKIHSLELSIPQV